MDSCRWIFRGPAWRYASADIPEEVHDRLTGHAPQTVSRGYGKGHSLPTLAAAIARIPLPPGLTVPGYTNGATQADMLAIPRELPALSATIRVRSGGKSPQRHAPKVAKRKLVPGRIRAGQAPAST